MSIITYPLNGVTYDAEDVSTYLCTRTSGVYAKETNFAVSITGTRQITIAPGLAWINYDDFKGVSVCSRENTALTVPDADNTLNRVDRVVLQFDTSNNLTAIRLKPGTPAVAAQPPEILQNHNIYELGLCTVSVPAGSSAITAADITDTRTDEAVCGVMRDGVTGIPTGTLVRQWQAVIESMKGGSFYTRAEVDALLKTTPTYSKTEVDALLKTMQTTLQQQISAASAITASGNGYIRFSDGTQICWNTAKLSSSSGNYVFTFPVPFINTTYAVAGFKADRISDTNYNNFCYHTKTTGRVEIDSAYNGYSDKLYSTLIAIGRWK